MKKHGWTIAVLAIAGLAVTGYFLSQAVVAAPQQSGRESNKDTQETVGTVVAEIVQPDIIGAGAGIKKTINIPPAAFVPDGGGTIYTISPSLGYIVGDAEGNTSIAPVIFPKGAKKILHVDFYVRDTYATGYSVYFKLYDSYPWTTATRTPIINYYSSYYSGSIVKYICTPSTQTIAADHVYYLSMFAYETGYLYGAIVYYQ